jgi:predicted RNA-binding protein YlxR (DUF448 family)
MRNPRNEQVSSDIPDGTPERKCILSGSHGARGELVRLAISPPGPNGMCIVLPDVQARAPGRGAWIGVSRETLENALSKGKLKGALLRAFNKSLSGATLSIPDDLPERIDTALMRLFAERLGLEMKAGNVVLGSDRIAEQARAGRITWLAHAGDAARDGSNKLDQAWRVGREVEGSGLGGAILPLDRAALSVALGRDNVVHLASSDAGAAKRIDAPLQRLLHFRGLAEANAVEAPVDADELETTGNARGPDTAPLAVTTN